MIQFFNDVSKNYGYSFTNQMKIEILIEEQLESLWNQLGLSKQDQEDQYTFLNKKVQNLFGSYLKELSNQVKTAQNDAEKLEAEVESLIEKFDLQINRSLDKSLPLIFRIQNAQAALEIVKNTTIPQQQEFEITYSTLMNAYDVLEIPIQEREVQSEKGIDYSIGKIEEMNNIINELAPKICQRESHLQDICSKINVLNCRLGLPHVNKPKRFGDNTIKQYEDLLESTVFKLQQNENQFDKLQTEIESNEKLLNIPSTPLKLNNVLQKNTSDQTINNMKSRLNILQDINDNNLSNSSKLLKSELRNLWSELHIPTPSKTNFPFYYIDPPTRRSVIALQTEVRRLENEKIQISPLLDLITQRENLLKKSQGYSNPELSKIHERMIQQLQDYETMFGEPFLWDGHNLLKEIQKVHQIEIIRSIHSDVQKQNKTPIPSTKRMQSKPSENNYHSFMI